MEFSRDKGFHAVKSRKILITGGTGFIGKHLATALLGSGHELTLMGRSSLPAQSELAAHARFVTADLADSRKLEEAIAGQDVVFHKASSHPDLCRANDLDLFQSNIVGTQALIDVLRKSSSISHLIFDSSISVYGEGCYGCSLCGEVRPPVRSSERSILSSFEPCCPNCNGPLEPLPTTECAALAGVSSYAMSKKVQEELLELASEQLGFRLTVFRYATVYGPGQRSTSPYARFISSVCNGESVMLNEDGLQKRDFIHVDDVVRANLLALAQRQDRQKMNIGSCVETTLYDFVGTAIECSRAWLPDSSAAIRLSQAISPGDIRHCQIDCSRAKNELGFEAKIAVRQGICELIESTFSRFCFEDG